MSNIAQRSQVDQASNEEARRQLACQLFGDGVNLDYKKAIYIAKLFPDILLDIVIHLSDQAIKATRQETNQEVIIQNQLKPYFAFNLLLGKCPQITGLMYTYFENSSFQPLPVNMFQRINQTGKQPQVTYTYSGFSDDLVKQILFSLFKYLSFNPRWFSSIWNWSELSRFVSTHTNHDIKYLAACCLAIITRPTRPQHISIIHTTFGKDLIELQIKHRSIYDNTFKPCLETKTEKREQLAQSFGFKIDTYQCCQDTFAKLANVLLIKNDVKVDEKLSNQLDKIMKNYVPIRSLVNNVSKIAYNISINKPCLIKGISGSGKTALLDYIAAHTYRLNPPDYIKIQVGDQIDSKLLIGSYVCTDIPGQFDWKPGPLTRAMIHGSWIVFEDIDTAPADMAQVIHSVIENGNLACISCPIRVHCPHPDFRVFLTQRTKDNKQNNFIKQGFNFFERSCEIIEIEELTDTDLKEILDTKYKFASLTETIIKMFRKTQNIIRNIEIPQGTRAITSRDLFKFCDRLFPRVRQLDSGTISLSALQNLYLDAVDCFLSSLPKDDLIDAATILGEAVNIAAEDVERLVTRALPEVREDNYHLKVGRAELKIKTNDSSQNTHSRPLAHTKQSLQLIEKITICIKQREPVLLVGETGVGKTTLIQYLAEKLRTKLTIVNLSHQSDSSDLLGDYKPVDAREIMSPLNHRFEDLFNKSFDSKSNRTFLEQVNNCYMSAKQTSNWLLYLKLLFKLCVRALDKPLNESILSQWSDLHTKVTRLIRRLSNNKECPMALAFTEGSLLRAVKKGEWLLLDEVNLAEPEVLQCLILILDALGNSCFYRTNLDDQDEPFTIHENFRLFACMNPSTDIGKKNLAEGTRNRFSEFFVDDITQATDLRLVVESYVKSCLSSVQIDRIVNFYLELKARRTSLSDISGNSPVHSLRSLCRALTICANNVCQNNEKSLFESLKITFLQQLNEASSVTVMRLIEEMIYDKKSFANVRDAPISIPRDKHNYAHIEGYWVQIAKEQIIMDPKYILTNSISRNLQSLARIVSLSQRKLPILVQGNTSVGKTSLIMHLARMTGNKCYRVNNHEHTDLQEYVGRYVFKENGKLVFQDGLLVKAMRRGSWIILDELNLAPSELLEALNRVLDDNRELFIPETRETVKAHSKFVLFATQNPPEEYAGRKLLSRAFRNRFIELHFDEIPKEELEIILSRRCEMPPQYAKKIVTVMTKLQLYRRESGCFSGKGGFMTMRDLFRWGERYATFKRAFNYSGFFDWEYHLATEGLILLEGRVRTKEEADVVKTCIEKVFNKMLDRDLIYKLEFSSSSLPIKYKHIYFSREFRRLFVQMSRALKYQEPVLLCGQTGCGKTTACQLYAAMNERPLLTYNCHLNTESSDFVGGVRPSRSESKDSGDLKKKSKQTYPWVDGPLVSSMKVGSIFLMDEISLADDAVLERINSVLEPNRSITLTEKEGEEIFANAEFRLVATMNPGGDYGKKELSPALRNRFTEIYCHNTTDILEIRNLIEAYLPPTLLKPKIAPALLSITHGFLKTYYKDHESISIRDILSWILFIAKTTHAKQLRPLSIQEAIVNGASLVFFDQFGTCGHKSLISNASSDLKRDLKKRLRLLVELKFGVEPVYVENPTNNPELDRDVVHFMKFYLNVGQNPINPEQVRREFVLETPTVKMNVMKLVRALQLSRPVLLEGDPGAGKTSAVAALAKLTGHKLVRINLSEQTDISDLFGSDLPDLSDQDSSDENPTFSWHDGPMLRAIRDSKWILLDEMNLASQSVLEGLNACFDHRGEIYISELNKTFTINKSTTRIFACQNPYSQGAARKGLPQSFLNRFTAIYIESHSPRDLALIVENLYPSLPKDLIQKMVNFNAIVSETFRFSGFEFNLRDLLHWCELVIKCVTSEEFKKLNLFRPDKFVQFVYLDRMRSQADRQEVVNIFNEVFDQQIYEPAYRDIRVGEHSLFLCRSVLPRKVRPAPLLHDFCILKYQLPYLESMAKAIEHNKMPIIVGEAGSGKKSIVKILAGLTGNQLNIMCANEEMDTIELLGSYEQRSIQRDIVDLIEECKDLVTSIVNAIPEKKAADSWTSLFGNVWLILYSASQRDHQRSNGDIVEEYHFNLMKLRELLVKMQLICSNSDSRRCSKIASKVEKLLMRTSLMKNSSNTTGSFEWVDSLLVKSVREGHWLMIENANLMNPATLDRLNSLVEVGGNLSLSEKGSDSLGNIETITPHPDFRLIITMNPEYGELSRAMRNRGVEIYVRTRFYFEDFLLLLDQNGFEPGENRACMTYCVMKTSCKFHKKVTSEDPAEDGAFLSHFGLNYIPRLTHEVRRGQLIDSILFELLVSCYKKRGFIDECNSPELKSYIMQKLEKLKKKYVVNFHDELYLWQNFRHNLPAITGGESDVAMAEREYQLFNYNFGPSIEAQVLKPDEMVDFTDTVAYCVKVKIFMELASYSDFEYRKGFVKEFFSQNEDVLSIVTKHIESIDKEHIPWIKSCTPESQLSPAIEWTIDSRNSPDLHYYLLALDYKQMKKHELNQNRWILSLYRIMLGMIVDSIEENTSANKDLTSMWLQSERCRVDKMPKENLSRPIIGVASDLYELFDAILKEISTHSFTDDMVVKMLPKLFWLNYFICRLKRALNHDELIATCNQLPMLWTLTHQKIISPLLKEFKSIGEKVHKNKKISKRIQDISEALEVNMERPTNIEKSFYKKIVNSYAATTKICDETSKEVEKFFNLMIGRYTSRSQSFYITDSKNNLDTIMASGLVWSNSKYMQAFYRIQQKLLSVELAIKFCDNAAVAEAKYDQIYSEEAKQILSKKQEEYRIHEDWLKDEIYRSKCINLNKVRNALDQYTPVWQFKLLMPKLLKLLPTTVDNPHKLSSWLSNTLLFINGIVMSPNYYGAVIKFLQTLINRMSAESLDNSAVDLAKYSKENLNMYTTYLAETLSESIVMEHQVVGWTKLRTTTSDLASHAPIIPEYSPILSLVASYCLDINHLKLSSHSESTAQLESLMKYLWRDYTQLKLDSDRDVHELKLAQNLIHMRSSMGDPKEIVGDYQCDGGDCHCIQHYINKRSDMYSSLIKKITPKLQDDDLRTFDKALKLIEFGKYIYLEYAPLFSIDPSVRAREKLDVYKSELSHIKLDLHFKNYLYYWKTGENLQLNELEGEDATSYPFSMQVFVDRRAKLEKSITRLQMEHTKRPKTDDGAQYSNLRKEVEINISHYTPCLDSILNDLVKYVSSRGNLRTSTFDNLVAKCRLTIRNLEKTISTLKRKYSLYSDLTTNFVVGLCFVYQGLRCLYARMEQMAQISSLKYDCSIKEFEQNIVRLFSLNNMTQGGIDSASDKLRIYPHLKRLCPLEITHKMQTILLKSVLIQLNHQIIITPSDIPRCFPVVKKISDMFSRNWMNHKEELERKRRENEEKYQYKTSTTTLGNEINLEKQEFIEICTNFPTYNHVFKKFFEATLTSADIDNLMTEHNMSLIDTHFDLTMCIDVCKAHYRFIKEASCNLLGQVKTNNVVDNLPDIDLSAITSLEAELLYTITRNCIPALGRNYDSSGVEYHILQANKLHSILEQKNVDSSQCRNSNNSVEILDEDVYDIYHDSNPYEALKFQQFLCKLGSKIGDLRHMKVYDNNHTIKTILELIGKISSFLLTDPLIKFVTGSHILLEKVGDWNRTSIPKSHKIIEEADILVDMISEWRKLEVQSWKNSLHRVKKKYVDSTLCDLWFVLYRAFNDPIHHVKTLIRQLTGWNEFSFTTELFEEHFYQGFASHIKGFLESSTIGDYKIRLDLVFSFAIEMRFASLYEGARPNYTNNSELDEVEKQLVIDFEKLMLCVYNMYILYKGKLEPAKDILIKEEGELSKKLNTEITIVNWQSRNLWDIKNNFRISHSKLNRVMNKYKEVLATPVVGSIPTNHEITKVSNGEISMDIPDSQKVSVTLASIQVLINDVEVLRITSPSQPLSKSLSSIVGAEKVVQTMKGLHKQTSSSMMSRLVGNLNSIEDNLNYNKDAVKNFYSHKVESVTIMPNDTKEQRDEKHKLCRQIYHNKKYLLQSIFKNLNGLGARYQRGLNSQSQCDGHVLKLEPLRGMMKKQSHSVMKAASTMVEDALIASCNEQYNKLITLNAYVNMNVNEKASRDLTSDQYQRIQGYSFDFVIDAVKQMKVSANIYKHLIDVQGPTTRLQKLHDKLTKERGNQVIIYNFDRVHSSICKFNEFVGKAYLAVMKLVELCKCYKPTDIEKIKEEMKSGLNSESSELAMMIDEISENNSLMTRKQYERFKSNLDRNRKTICEVSYELRDLLYNTSRNYLYSDDDIENLIKLFREFYNAFTQLAPCHYDKNPNVQPGTVLGSLRLLLEEFDRDLSPILIKKYFSSKDATNPIDISTYSNAERLNLRLRKLLRQIKLAAQGIYQEEKRHIDQQSSDKPLSEKDKRNLLPFNYIDSVQLKNLLRLNTIAQQLGDCFQTVNISKENLDTQALVVSITPVLSIYTQQVTSYLNVILSSLKVKLENSNQLLAFFLDLTDKGFGLPNKIMPEDGSGGQTQTSKSFEDNAGFGDGAGETDVSKKLEYESQLDELKKDGQDQSGENVKEEESVEAHDDGVEMSTDIDAKAEGPDQQQNGQDQPEENEEEDEDDQHDLDELDKELDSVDQDEGLIDQKLWNDQKEDETDQPDDKDDLREAEAKQETQIEKEETQIGAKDNQLTDAKTSEKGEIEPNGDDNEVDRNQPNEKKQSNDTNDDEMVEDIDEQAVQLDLNEEAGLAQQEVDQNIDDKQETDMSIDDLGLEEINDDDSFDLEREPNDQEDKNGQGSDGELGHDEFSTPEEFNGQETKEDNEEIKSNGAQEIQMTFEQIHEQAQDSVSKSSGAANEGGKGQNNSLHDDMKEKIGLNTIYHIFHEDNKDLEYDDDNRPESKSQDAVSGDQQEKDDDKPAPGSSTDIKNNSNEATGVDEQDQNIDEKLREDEIEPESENPTTKRSISIDDSDYKDIKRQKIIGDKEERKNLEEEKEVESKEKMNKCPVKHAGPNSKQVEEVIDLISSDDEDNQCLKNQLEVELQEPEGQDKMNASVMEQIDNELKKRSTAREHDSLDTDRLTNLWIDCTRQTGHLVHELCQQLQIVLQPTKMAKYKGDYKTGKRLNMRKIISYIASYYMKDKIWLRRTKPSKRTYNIMIAVDNSSSMHENNCRQMTYQSLALLAKSLSLIEAGSLSVVKFGQEFRCIHEFGQPYMDAIGAQWLRELRFDDTRTSYSSLLRDSCESFANQSIESSAASAAVSQLLIIISDGRNISSEEDDVRMYLKQLKSMKVLTLFVIIDDLSRNDGKSIVDVMRTIGIGSNMKMLSYMQLFPFPFYVILRRLELMPSILGDALRQWFELVTSGGGA